MAASSSPPKRRILDLALKDLRQISRDRKSFIFLLVMPVIFTLLFGFAFGGSSTADPRLPIGLADEDGSGQSAQLAAMLEQSGVLRIEARDEPAAALNQQVVDETLAAAVIIPAGFGQALLAGDDLPLTVTGSGQTGYTIEGEVQTTAARLASAVQAASLSAETAAAQDLFASDAERLAYFEEAFDRALAAWQSPPVTIVHAESSALSDEAQAASGNYSIFAHSSPGMMAQFAIAGLLGAAGILVVEKKTKSLQRLLTTNMSRGEIIAGHFLAMFIMIFLQLVTLMLFGQLFLDLPYLSQPLATVAMTVATALFTAGLGMLIGVASKTEEQVVILSLVPMFVLSALGGAWVPLEFTPESFQRVAGLTPVAFVMDGYKDILVRGQGLAAVSPALIALLAYTAVLLILSVWRFRFE
ncbi:MAG: ABC transporter permease [Candidatus Promineifilaceae bacterium]